MKPTVAIIGAGPAGLTAAYILAKGGVQVTVLEADAQYVGGISRTVTYKGYHFDIGGHRFFSKSEEVERLWDEILPEDMLIRPRSSRIYYRGKFFSYPLRAFEALAKLGIIESVRCGFSYLQARLFPVPNPQNFADWVSNQFGRRLFGIFFKTYTEKVWGMDCREISADWAAQRIKGLSLGKAIWSALFPSKVGSDRHRVVKTLINSFRYPRLGPGMMWEACAAKVTALGGEVAMGRKVTGAHWEESAGEWTITHTDADGRSLTLEARHLISSAPVRTLARVLTPALPAAVMKAANALRYRDFLTVVLIYRHADTFADNWIYIHEPGVKVGRIQNFKSWSPQMVPDPATACYGLEYFCFEGDKLWASSDEELIALAKREMGQLGLADAGHYQDGTVVRQRKAYPVYDADYTSHVEAVRAELERSFPTLHLVGRNGMHKYNNQDHSMMTAMLCAKNIIAGDRHFDPWRVNEDAEYHETSEPGVSSSGLRQVPAALRSAVNEPEGRPAGEAGGKRRLREQAAAFLIICALIFPFVLCLGVTKGLSHDEHQHIAAGALVAREGLLPYRDFPHFHTPYLAFVYAGLFRTTDHLLLAARLFSVVCGTAIVALVGAIAWSLFRARGRGIAVGVSAGSVLLCLSAGVFSYTTGRAWNQEPALLFTMLAFCLHVAGVRQQKKAWFVGCGILLGIAIGLRITVAPLLAPFGLSILLFSAPRWNLRLLLPFVAGTLLGTAGLMVFFVIAPEQTFFGNFGFAKVNVAFRFGSGEPRTMTLLKKFRYVWKEIIRRDVPLFAFSLLPLVALRLASLRTQFPRLRFEFWFILLLAPFLMLGSLAPSPLFTQYFYPAVPFLVLTGLYGMAALAPGTRAFRRTLFAGAVMVIFSTCLGWHAYRRIGNLMAFSEWAPVEIHRSARRLFARVPLGPILTLAPIYPLEAARPIYPALATGPFAWRVAEFVEPTRADRLGMVAPATLETWLEKDPPAGIFLGKNPDAQPEFLEYARRHAYQVDLRLPGDNLWLPP